MFHRFARPKCDRDNSVDATVDSFTGPWILQYRSPCSVDSSGNRTSKSLSAERRSEDRIDIRLSGEVRSKREVPKPVASARKLEQRSARRPGTDGGRDSRTKILYASSCHQVRGKSRETRVTLGCYTQLVDRGRVYSGRLGIPPSFSQPPHVSLPLSCSRHYEPGAGRPVNSLRCII